MAWVTAVVWVTGQVPSLAREFPHAAGAARNKKQKQKQTKKKKKGDSIITKAENLH